MYFSINYRTKIYKHNNDYFLYSYENGDWKFYRLNKTGYKLWKFCNNQPTSIATSLSESSTISKKKILNFIELLKKENLLLAVKTPNKNKSVINMPELLEVPIVEKFIPKQIFPVIPTKGGIPPSAVIHPSGPLYFYFEVTLSCNLQCKHCYAVGKNNTIKELSTDQVKKIIDKLTSHHPAVKILFIGGEPFMRRDIFDILKYAKDKNIIVDISTNGWLLDKNKIKKLKEIKVDKINLTLYDSNGKFDETFSIKGHFLKMMELLECIKKEKLTTDICFVMTKVNFWELFKVYKIAKEFKVSRFDINQYMPTGQIPKEQEMKFLLTPFQTALFWGVIEPFILRFFKNPPVHASKCYYGTFPCIKPNGEVVPCNGASFAASVGNILNENLDTILKRLKAMSSWEVKPCSICLFKYICIGGCKIGYNYGAISCPIGRLLMHIGIKN